MSSDFANINADGFAAVGTFTPDKLFDRDTIEIVGSIGAGNLPRGALLGVITATGQRILSTAAANDGSQVPESVLLEPVDATAAPKAGAIAIAGRFGIQGVTFGAGHTAASVFDVLRTKDIYLENIVG